MQQKCVPKIWQARFTLGEEHAAAVWTQQRSVQSPHHKKTSL